MALALAVEAKDPYSAGHSKRVGFYATQIAQEMGLGEEVLRILNDAGILHDIGKIGIKGEAIPLGARVLAVADTYDAMVTDRPYRKRLSVDETKRELKKGAGAQHD